MRLALVLAQRFGRSKTLARSTAVIVLTATFLVAIFVVLRAFTLSPAQVVERDLGRFGAYAGFGAVTVKPGDDRVARALEAAVRDAGADDVMVSLVSVDLDLSDAGSAEIGYHEADWSSTPFADRFPLVAGRWPSRPGEVTITGADNVSARVGDSLAVLSGGAHLRVVGIAKDRYARKSTLLAARGTWAALPADAADRFAALQAQPVVYWDGSHAAAVLDAVAETIAPRATAPSPELRRSVAESFRRRADVAHARARTWIGRTPAGYTIPSVVLPLLAVLLVFGLSDRRFRKSTAILVSVGVARWQAVAGLSLAVLRWAAGAAVLGSLVGLGLGAGAARVVGTLRDMPISPVADVHAPVVRLTAMTLIGVVAAGLLLLRSPGENGGSGASRRAHELTRAARRLAALAAGCAAFVLALGVDTPAKAMILSAVFSLALLALTPELVAFVLARLPETGPRLRLGRRQLTTDQRRVGVAVVLLGATLGGSLGFLTLLDTSIKTAGDETYPDVLPGQLVIADRSSQVFPPPRDVVRAARRDRALRDRDPIPMRYLMKLSPDHDLLAIATLKGTDGALLAVDRLADAGAMLGRALAPAERAALQRGGVLAWGDIPTPPMARVEIVVRAGGRELRRTQPLEVAQASTARSAWRAGTGGMLLASSARRLKLPITTGALMYTGLSRADTRSVRHTVMEAGLDPRTVQIYERPAPVVTPVALTVTALALVTLVLVMTIAATRGQARALRDYLGLLLTIGVSPRWARQVLLYQHGIIVAIGTAVAIPMAIVPVLIAAARMPGFVLSVPWGQLLVVGAAVYLATFAAAAASSRRLTARERSMI